MTWLPPLPEPISFVSFAVAVAVVGFEASVAVSVYSLADIGMADMLLEMDYYMSPLAILLFIPIELRNFMR